MTEPPPSLKLLPSDIARRAFSILLGIITVILFALGTRAFASLVTKSFSSAGFAIVPLGMFIVGIFLIPLMSAVHGFWITGSPDRRAAVAERNAREEAKVRLSAAQAREWAERGGE